MDAPGGLTTDAPRPSWRNAMIRGAIGRCPACGEGRLFSGYLKVADACGACGTELHHHRADDLPPYIVIFIVGHAVVAGLLAAEMAYEVPLWLHFAIWPTLIVGSSLALLQPAKGAVVGLQYALGMHGFSRPSDEAEAIRQWELTRGRHERTDADGPAHRDGA